MIRYTIINRHGLSENYAFRATTLDRAIVEVEKLNAEGHGSAPFTIGVIADTDTNPGELINALDDAAMANWRAQRETSRPAPS